MPSCADVAENDLTSFDSSEVLLLRSARSQFSEASTLDLVSTLHFPRTMLHAALRLEEFRLPLFVISGLDFPCCPLGRRHLSCGWTWHWLCGNRKRARF